MDILESEPFTSGAYTTAFIAEAGPSLPSLGGEAA
jgi:hypothetical protein